MPNGKQQRVEPMVMMQASVLDNVLGIIANAPMGCGMTAKENAIFRQTVMGNTQLVPPPQPLEATEEPAAEPAEQLVREPESFIPENE